MTLSFREVCGCSVAADTGRISYCQVHAAAPELLAMLDEVVDGGYLDAKREEKRRILRFLEKKGLRARAEGGLS